MAKTTKEICKAISADWKLRRLTHRDAAGMLGTSKQTVSNNVSGQKKRISGNMARRLSDVFGYDIRFLLFGEGGLYPEGRGSTAETGGDGEPDFRQSYPSGNAGLMRTAEKILEYLIHNINNKNFCIMQGLGNFERKTYLGIASGKITLRKGDGQKEEYSYFEGELKDIVKRDAVINGSPMTFYDFEMDVNGTRYVLSVQHNSSSARSIILCLGGVENIRGAAVKIVPWLSAGRDGSHKDKPFTNVTVYVNGDKVKWCVDALPPVKYVKLSNGKEVADDGERVALVENYINVIKGRLNGSYDAETGEVTGPIVDIENFDDMPADLG